jgi:uncharacterized membrane protein YeaQ/YmgE (transglycosylase-associated protein family)
MSLTASAALGWVVVGLVMGVLARAAVPGHAPLAWLDALVVGCLGAVAGGLAATALKLGADPSSPAGWMLSVMGAAAALVVYHAAVLVRRPV